MYNWTMKDVIEKAYKALSRRCENVVMKRKLSVIGFRIVHGRLALECKTHDNDLAVIDVLYKRKHNNYYTFMNFPKHASRVLSCREVVHMLMRALSKDDVVAVTLDFVGSPLDANWFMHKHDTLDSLAIEHDLTTSKEHRDNEP